MNNTRRTLLGLILGAAVALNAVPAAAAYPDRPVRVVVPYAAGGPTDIAARLVADALGRRLNQTFFIENRPGAGGNIGAEYTAKAAPDGYTLLVIGAAHAINKSLYSKVAYDVQRDFEPIAGLSTAPLILLANPTTGFKSVSDFIAVAKARPGVLNYCSAGIGTAPHLAMEWLKEIADINVLHVPYRGSTPCIADLISGQVQISFDSLLVWQQHATSGRLTALAVTGTQRSEIAPATPTMAEAGFGKVDAAVWYGLVAPAGTPAAIVKLLSDNIAKILEEPAIVARLRSLGALPLVKSPEAFGTFIGSEVTDWAVVVKASGAKAE